MTEMSNNQEGVLVGVAAACGAGATFLASQPIPDSVKVPACAVLGFVSVVLFAFWNKKVNMPT